MIRTPGPRERVTDSDTPTPQMAAWMREMTKRAEALDALVARLKADDVLPEDWPHDE
jgi:hypothetical protein